MELTTIEWLANLPEGYKAKALKYYLDQSPLPAEKRHDNMASALLYAFDWGKTVEGWKFWDAVCDFYETGAELPILNKVIH
jgi:hypothetical protein